LRQKGKNGVKNKNRGRSKIARGCLFIRPEHYKTKQKNSDYYPRYYNKNFHNFSSVLF